MITFTLQKKINFLIETQGKLLRRVYMKVYLVFTSLVRSGGSATSEFEGETIVAKELGFIISADTTAVSVMCWGEGESSHCYPECGGVPGEASGNALMWLL